MTKQKKSVSASEVMARADGLGMKSRVLVGLTALAALTACGPSQLVTIVAGDDSGAPPVDASSLDAPPDASSSPCASFQVSCSGACVDPSSDPEHCGACNNTCPAAPHARPQCTLSACSILCDPGFTDCDHVASNGCEADLQSDPGNCGTCGAICVPHPNQAGICTQGHCLQTCLAGFADCDGLAANGCETNIGSDGTNCGACGNTCPGFCQSGICACATGTSCGSVCANLQTDPSNCGNCGTACGQGQPCVGGKCGCSGATPDVCNGACVDLQTDPSNCGACNAPCASPLACSAGVCVPKPTVIASTFQSPRNLAVDANNVYVSATDATGSSYGIYQISKNAVNGTPLLLASGETTLRTLLTDGKFVYWDGLSIRRAAVGTSGATTLASVQTYEGMTMSGSTLFWGSASGILQSMPAAGGAVTTLGTASPGSPVAVAADAANLYFAVTSNSGGISRIAQSGGSVIPVTTTGPYPGPLAVDSTTLYFLVGSAPVALASVPVGGGSVTLLVPSIASPGNLVVDSGNVYFCDASRVLRIPATGGPPTVLAAAQGQPMQVAVDATSVYWVDFVAGTLMKAPK